ncbi:nucleoside-diphosphate sugar epimerase [Aquimarina sp. 2201CG1-2-11]|uniref:nucleoside-diphosphate sugar epimerase n=1 Tax=Aquimarina discodermiae TaxID=3231043 RepID=UPI00346362ED
MKQAIILGATGLTGGMLLDRLLEDNRYRKIKLFSRKSIGISHPKVTEYIVDLLCLEDSKELFVADEVFCCIGTTHSKTPDKNLYHQIDYGIPVTAAKLCSQNNINTLLVVSALGANPKSSIFYNRTKGEMEEAVLNYPIPKTHILQPSLIGGNRKEKRTGEYFFKLLMKLLNPILIGAFKKYRTIAPETIVSSMIWLANNEFLDTRISSEKIKELAQHSF